MTIDKTSPSSEERVQMGQSLAQGDTGDGDTGVPAGEQGISNRPGDLAADEAEEPADEDDDDDEDEDDDEDDEDDGDEDDEAE